MTAPATRTRRPWRPRGRSMRAQHAAQRQLLPPQRQRMRTDRQARAGVIGHQPLGGVIGRSGDSRPELAASGRVGTFGCRESSTSCPVEQLAGRPRRPARSATTRCGDRSRTRSARRSPPASPARRGADRVRAIEIFDGGDTAASRTAGARGSELGARGSGLGHGARRTVRSSSPLMRADVAERRPRPAFPRASTDRRSRTLGNESSTSLGRRRRSSAARESRAPSPSRRRSRSTSAHLLPQPIHIHQPQTHAAVGLDAALPVGLLHVDRREAHAVALRILDQRRRMIEPHRLVVQHRGVERRRIVRLQIRARIDEQREARGVRFREIRTARTT